MILQGTECYSLCYASKILDGAQINCATTVREFLAMIFAK
jgi:hypothetical protein